MVPFSTSTGFSWGVHNSSNECVANMCDEKFNNVRLFLIDIVKNYP